MLRLILTCGLISLCAAQTEYIQGYLDQVDRGERQCACNQESTGPCQSIHETEMMIVFDSYYTIQCIPFKGSTCPKNYFQCLKTTSTVGKTTSKTTPTASTSTGKTTSTVVNTASTVFSTASTIDNTAGTVDSTTSTTTSTVGKTTSTAGKTTSTVGKTTSTVGETTSTVGSTVGKATSTVGTSSKTTSKTTTKTTTVASGEENLTVFRQEVQETPTVAEMTAPFGAKALEGVTSPVPSAETLASEDELSPSAKIGIGVGAGSLLLIVMLALAVFSKQRRGKRTLALPTPPVDPLYEVPDAVGAWPANYHRAMEEPQVVFVQELYDPNFQQKADTVFYDTVDPAEPPIVSAATPHYDRAD